MIKIGIVGGFSYLSTVFYYTEIIKRSQQKSISELLSIVIHHIDQLPVMNLAASGNWGQIFKLLGGIYSDFITQGASIILLPCNSLHKAFDFMLPYRVPSFFSIIDSVGRFCVKNNYKKVLLLGTKITMCDGFYQSRLSHVFNIDVVIPDDDIDVIHHFLLQKLCVNRFCKSDLLEFSQLCHSLFFSFLPDALLLSCTELTLLAPYLKVPFVDSAQVHVHDLIDSIASDMGQ